MWDARRDMDHIEKVAMRQTIEQAARSAEVLKAQQLKLVKWLCDQSLLLITEPRPMVTDCSSEQFVFEGFAGRQVVGAFDGGEVTPNGGAKLRPANIDASAGAKEEIARIVAHLRKAWPDVVICLRADSGFARDALMS